MFRRFGRAATVLTAASLIVVAAPVPAFADDVRDDQWYLDALDVGKAHELSQGEGITIGLVDTGVDADHPDIDGNVRSGTSFGDVSGDGLKDAYDHGTGIASIAVGHGHGDDNSEGIIGIAPRAKLISVNPGCDSKCDFPDDGLTDSIRWLVDKKVDVISVSMGDTPKEDNAAVDYATSRDIPVVASAGNVRTYSEDLGVIDVKGTAWPALGKGAIPVAGTTKSGKFWKGSQDLTDAAVQPQLGISAPAENLPAASSGGGYATHSGTSGSAPIVAGTLALIKSAYPDLDYNQWLDRLLDTVDDKGSKEFDNKFGWGIVNPYKALTEKTTYEGLDGDQVSSPDDRLPLDEQGKGASGKSKGKDGKKSDGDDNALTASSTSLLIPVLIAVAVLLVIAFVVILVIAKRRNKTPPPPVAPPGTA